jgi:hypothetical protein
MKGILFGVFVGALLGGLGYAWYVGAIHVPVWIPVGALGLVIGFFVGVFYANFVIERAVGRAFGWF